MMMYTYVVRSVVKLPQRQVVRLTKLNYNSESDLHVYSQKAIKKLNFNSLYRGFYMADLRIYV